MLTTTNLRIYKKFLILAVLLGGFFFAVSVNNKAKASICCTTCYPSWVACLDACQHPIHEKWIACVEQNCDPALGFCTINCDPLC